jgi:pyridoxamine 5'-phosphate oxidase-like protein
LKWSEFAAAAPDLAALGQERFRRAGIVLVGTIRQDGTPRISPVEYYEVEGHLMLGMMWQSFKARDLLRDPRCLVHSVVTSRAGDEGEFKLRGRVVDVPDPALRAAYGDATEAEIDWRPTEPFHLFSLDIEEAAFVIYEEDEQRTTRWTRADGLTFKTGPPA